MDRKKVVSGIDIVYLPRFKRSLKNGGENFLKRVFFQEELSDSIEHLAGIFAAKEAIIKALDLPTDNWSSVKITHTKSGSPLVSLISPVPRIIQTSLSISHDGNYVIAQFVGILEDDVTN